MILILFCLISFIKCERARVYTNLFIMVKTRVGEGHGSTHLKSIGVRSKEDYYDQKMVMVEEVNRPRKNPKK